ncbi:MAG: hypothetical protein KBT03_03855 [Bacteroidales bacterium]|nr:hypothetical protein [Candidatus Scybalousia scybalohippi]
MWIFYNPNPKAIRVGDCVIRAISKLTNQSWEETYLDLTTYGLMKCDMPSANAVWGSYLRDKGYVRDAIDNSCPDCYCVADFAREHPRGKYLLAISGHVVAVEDGDWYDSWDSYGELPQYYWKYGR